MPKRPPCIVGFDIGGANIKVANDAGRSQSIAFPLWKRRADLAQCLSDVRRQFAAADHYAVTMTGELADCFLDRGEGVRDIVDQASEALGPAVLFYTVDGKFLSAAEARDRDDVVSASNWHAMGSLAARWCGGDGLWIDVGSTTSDFIPLAGGTIHSTSRTDHDRLSRGELIYVGIGRTPVCAVVDSLPYLGEFSPIMNEVFATTDDCALLSGLVAPAEDDCESCDGRPRTLHYAANRMARMIGLDHRQVTIEDARIMSAFVIERLRAQMMVAAQVLSSPSAVWLLSGHGSMLISVPEDRRCLDLSAAMDPCLSRVGPAYAVARLALSHLAGIDPVPVLQ